jgi:predicted nuclease of restriction endonuclease-like (RecB) superfamily
MVMLYWDIGQAILKKQDTEGWGAKTIDRMAYDLQEEFPEMRGFSTRSLKYMRKFAECWAERDIVQASLAQIGWYQNIALLEKLKEDQLRLWYAQKTWENGWSHAALVHR